MIRFLSAVAFAATLSGPTTAAALTIPGILSPHHFPSSCAVQPPHEFANYYARAALQYLHSPSACELARQGYQESKFDPQAKSPAGALGIAQFLPSTAEQYGIDPLDPKQAIYGQAKYMAYLLKQWNPKLPGRTWDDRWRLALAAYNAGLGTLLKSQERHGWITWEQARPHMPRETQIYVKKIAD